MTFSRGEVFKQSQSAIAFVEGRQNPHSLTVTKDRITPDAKGRSTILANTWIAEITPGVYAPLPRAVVTTAFATGAATGEVNECWRYLKVGDVLRVVEPYVVLTVTTGWAIADTVALTLDGNAATYAVVGTAGVLPANIASELANWINMHPVLSSYVSAIASGAALYLYGKSLAPVSVAVTATTAGAGDVTITGPGSTPSRLVSDVNVGTILSINPNGTITLASNAAVAVPVGAHVGIPVRQIFGLYDIDQDMTNLDRYHLSPTNGAHGTYEQLLTYCDDLIKREFAAMNIRQKF